MSLRSFDFMLRTSISKYKTQLMLTNPRDAFRGQSRSPNMVLTFNGLKWNAMTNTSGDMAETSVTDFFTLSKFGRVSGFTNVCGPDNASKVVGS